MTTPQLDAAGAGAGSGFPGGEVFHLLDAARQRLPAGGRYAGDLYPREAWLLMLQSGAHLVDVRTRAEWTWVGHVSGSTLVEWETFPGNRRNPDFAGELAGHFHRDDLLLLMCRSGKRSVPACRAAAATGFGVVYNVLEGFEGDLDAGKHRSSTGGWRFSGLPWVQT
ncbi:MAG: rhodanese-like domain-containing protein [Burkholderiales bacterium]|nr:rhodanese-like domain-containing protein [Burkholderiales bacterium]